MREQQRLGCLIGEWSVLCLLFWTTTALPGRAGSWYSTPPESFNDLQTLEYFLRWDATDFTQRYSHVPTPWKLTLWHWLVGAPARAELPPEYQKAFSLRVQLAHSHHTLHLSYHYQRVIDDQSHHHAERILEKVAYDEFKALWSEPVSCTRPAPGDWVGPSPELIQLRYAHTPTRPHHLIFASTKATGPSGPSEEEYKAGQRRYLCTPRLKQWLLKQRQALEKKEKR